MTTSAAQVVPLVTVYDYILAQSGPTTTTATGLAGKQVKATLQYPTALTIAPDPVVWIAQQTTYATLTDRNGFWTLNLVPNNKISPANTYYVVEIEGGPSYKIQVTDVGVPGVGWQSSAPGILLDIPAQLSATTSTVGAITTTGLLTAGAGLTVVGALALPAASIADAALSANVALKNAANVFSAGQTISAGGLTVTGASTVTGTLAVTSTINGQTISAAAILTGTLTVGTGFTLAAGNLAITAGNLVFAAATAKIIPGATGLLVRNHADSASNLAMLDSGLATFLNALEVPPSVGAALPAHSYGTLPVKLDEQSTASAASLTLTVPAGALYRTLLVYFTGRSDQAAATNLEAQLNADTTANYDWQAFQDQNVTLTGIAPGIATAFIVCGILVPTGAVAGAETTMELTLENADSATLRKQLHFSGGGFEADTAAGSRYLTGHGQWRNTANAVTSIKLLPAVGNLVSARAVLYGIA